MALPAPVTVTDEILVALVRELRGLRADLAAAREPVKPEKPSKPPKDDTVELREPVPSKPRSRKAKTE